MIILYVFGSDFYHSLCLCRMLTLFFIVLACFVLKKQVSEVLATRFGDLQAARPSHEFTQNGFATQLATCQLRIAQKQLFKELFVGKLF